MNIKEKIIEGLVSHAKGEILKAKCRSISRKPCWYR